LMAAISLLMLAMVETGGVSIFSGRNLLLLIGSGVLLAAFLWVERRAPDPIIPFELFKNRTVLISVIAGFLGGVAMFGAISYVPLFAQGALGFTATEAGSLLTPLMLSWVTMSVVGGRLMLKLGYRTIAIIGFAVLTSAFVLLSMFQRETPRYLLYPNLMLIGAGLGLTMLTLLIAVQQAVERSRLGIATSLNQFSRSIGGALGVAIMGAVLTAGLASQLHIVAEAEGSGFTHEQASAFALNPNAIIEPAARAALPSDTLTILQRAMAGAIHPVFWVGAFMSFLALIASLFLPKPEVPTTDVEGERLVMAEQTNINARNQPHATIEPNEA
ncbi:MAG: MFS transporter, partial [Acidobacteria bacterium]|nr:MFS transporter [Acidobacteriota bacterium]